MDSRETVLAAIENVLRYHETGGHEGDGSDHAMRQARQAFEALRQPTPDATIAALEEPTPELVEIVARVYNQTRWGVAINLSGETVYRPTAHDAMTAALKAVAAHLRKA